MQRDIIWGNHQQSSTSHSTTRHANRADIGCPPNCQSARHEHTANSSRRSLNGITRQDGRQNFLRANNTLNPMTTTEHNMRTHLTRNAMGVLLFIDHQGCRLLQWRSESAWWFYETMVDWWRRDEQRKGTECLRVEPSRYFLYRISR